MAMGGDDDTFVNPKLSYNHLIPPFNGDDKTTIESFLKIMDSVKVMAGWSNLLAIAVLQSKLCGAASTFWQQCPDFSTATDYLAIRKALKCAYSVKYSHYRVIGKRESLRSDS